jgi:hypothetical protein
MKTTRQYQRTYKDGALAIRIALCIPGRPPVALEAFWFFSAPTIPSEEEVMEMLPSQLLTLLTDKVRMVWWYPEKEDNERIIKYLTLMKEKIDETFVQTQIELTTP